MSEVVAKRVTYVGRVQGVGFRFNAVRVAEKYSLVGFVRNLPNGNVELFAEGHKEQVQEFLDKISEDMVDYIDFENVVEEKPEAFFKDFSIKP